MCYRVQDIFTNLIGDVMYGRPELLVQFFFSDFILFCHYCIVEIILMHEVAYVIPL
jgi:hypothetical protein